MKNQEQRRPSSKIHIALFSIIFTFTIAACSAPQEVVNGCGFGNKAPDIVAQTVTGATSTLSAHAGSMVLVEFWDSNTSQARRNHQTLRQIYNSYKEASFKTGKGFCVFSVSLDTDKAKWEAACSEDGVSWPCNTIDTKGWNAASVLDYDIHYTPKYLLVDGNGIVIDPNVSVNELQKLLDAQLDS